MGTRCLTVFQNEQGKEIAVLYRQFDGDPDGHGQELKDYLKGKALTNGFGGGEDSKNFFNGMSCLAARVVAHFKKDEIGGFYLEPAGTRDAGEEYIYVVKPQKNDRERGTAIVVESFEAGLEPKDKSKKIETWNSKQ